MDSAEQAAGEKRVRQLLIEPLMRRGFMRPAGMKVDQFEAMLSALCAKLAYMSEVSLAALEEDVAGMAGGKDKDRFPVGQKILQRAADIQPPSDSASPLVRAVFANDVGRAALAGGYAPELLAEVKRVRKWPGSWAIKTARERGDDARRRLMDLDRRLARGVDLSPTDADWRARRAAVIAKCAALADQGGER